MDKKALMELIKNYVNQSFQQGVIDVVKEAFIRAGGVQLICALYVICILFVLVYRKHSNDRTKSVVGVYTVLALLLIVNPLFAYLLIKINGHSVYWRAFWLLFIQLTIVYAIVEFAFVFKKKWLNAVVLALGCVCILGTGKYMYTEENFQKVNNYYKIPDLALDIIQHVSEDENDYKVLAGPGEFQVFTRQIDSSIILTQGRTFSTYNPKSLCGYIESGDIANVSKKAISTKTNYIVIDNKFIGDSVESGNDVEGGKNGDGGDGAEIGKTGVGTDDNTKDSLTNYGWKELYRNEKYTLFYGDVVNLTTGG